MCAVAVSKEVFWPEVRDSVRRVNPRLADVIDQLNNKNAYPLYKISYPFGSHIIQAGQFQLPTKDGTLVALNNPRIPLKIQHQLNYHNGHIPLGLVLNRSVELFTQTKNKVIPYSMTKAGKWVGLCYALSPDHIWPEGWNMTAGARSIFVLPKITDTLGHRKLCRARNIKIPLPRDLGSHWSLLTKMAEDPGFSSPWFTEVLFFSKHWFNEKFPEDFLPFHYFLHQEGWVAIKSMLTKTIHDHVWDMLVRELSPYDVKASSFIVDMAKYMIMVGLGASPGFCPAIDEEEAPIVGLQEDFVKHYGLKQYAPTIMVPHHFSLADKRPVYCSLSLPTHYESKSKPKHVTSTLNILREIREIMCHFKRTMLKYATTKNHVTGEFLNNVQFDFFHSEPDIEGQIRLSLEMPKEDSSLTFCSGRLGPRRFSDVSPFVRGCVRFCMI